MNYNCHTSFICHGSSIYYFFFNETAPTQIYTLSLHDALPISERKPRPRAGKAGGRPGVRFVPAARHLAARGHMSSRQMRSEEHTSELQSPMYLVCRLLLEKKKKK